MLKVYCKKKSSPLKKVTRQSCVVDLLWSLWKTDKLSTVLQYLQSKMWNEVWNEIWWCYYVEQLEAGRTRLLEGHSTAWPFEIIFLWQLWWPSSDSGFWWDCPGGANKEGWIFQRKNATCSWEIEWEETRWHQVRGSNFHSIEEEQTTLGGMREEEGLAEGRDWPWSEPGWTTGCSKWGRLWSIHDDDQPTRHEWSCPWRPVDPNG